MMPTRKHAAMTLIEILIAIGVFAVGVLAVLQLVVNNIQTVDRVSKHMDATMLATQGLELMYELRNTNSYQEVEWDCYDFAIQGTTAECKGRLSSLATNQALMIAPAGPTSDAYWTVVADEKSDDITTNAKQFRLYRQVADTLTYFDHTKNDDPTPYARYITVETIDGYDATIALKLNSHVLVTQGSREPREVVISSIIGNIID